MRREQSDCDEEYSTGDEGLCKAQSVNLDHAVVVIYAHTEYVPAAGMNPPS